MAGHRGLAGSAVMRNLQAKGYVNLLGRTSAELDLRDKDSVDHFFETARPDYVFLAAAKVGGIFANSEYPAEFIFDNLSIQNNVIHAAYKYGVKKLMFLGSSCIYPKNAEQPIKEEYLLQGELEPTNESYAIAKIAGLKMCQAYNRQYGTNFISAMPTNLYGPGDNYDLKNSHVLPALLRKFHEARISNKPEVVVWGSGAPRREFLHVDDAADAIVHLMLHYNENEPVNIGCGEDHSIKDLAELLRQITGFNGQILFDNSKPDGTPRKLLDVGRIFSSGWRPQINLQDGLLATYRDFVENYDRYTGIKKFDKAGEAKAG